MKPITCSISVSEPWDFESPDGENIIIGKIIKIINKRCLIFKSNYLIKFNKLCGNILVLSPRYSEIDFSNLNRLKKSIVINGGLLSIKFNDNMEEEEIKEKSNFVLIGSVNL